MRKKTARETGGAANIKDVAARAGVSVGTVSNCLHGRPVRAATREKVEQAVRELRFIPDPGAQAIRARRSRSLVICIEQKIRASALWLETYLLALVEAAGERGYRCAIEHVDGTAPYPAERLFRRADGMVAIGRLEREFFTEFSAVASMPVISCWTPLDYAGARVIPYDFAASLRRAVAMLMDAGHTRIGFVSDNAGVGAEKINAWLRISGETLPGARCAWAEIINGFTESRQGFAAAQTLVTRCPELTAVIFSADIVAMAGMNGLAALGKRIPGDLSVVSMDNSFWAHATYPAVTSVGQDYPALARQIIGLVADGGAPAPAAFCVFPGATVRDIR